MSDKYEITHGPFAGRSLETAKLIPWRYTSGQPVIFGGREMRGWELEYLTPIFLELFDPFIGWAVVTDVVPLEGITLPDYQSPMIVDGKTVTNSFGGDIPSQLQVLRATATLINPEGRVIHQAVVLQGVHNLSSADLGMKKAKLQLYSALGLPNSPDSFSLPLDECSTTPTTTEATSPNGSATRQIRPISVKRSTSEGEDVTEDENPLGHVASSPEVEQRSQPTEGRQERTEEPAASPQISGDQVNNSHINSRVLAQVEHFAKLAGETVKQLKDDTEAKAELVRLRTASNKRK